MKLRASLCVGVIALLVGGCKEEPAEREAEERAGEEPAAAAACDEAAMAKLGSELEEMSSWAASRKVWPELEKACGDSIPASLADFFRPFDPESRAIVSDEALKELGTYKKRACPDIDSIAKEAASLRGDARSETIYSACDFARYDVIDKADARATFGSGLMSLTFHQWMLDAGVEVKTARPITRALFTQQSLGLTGELLPADFEMPEADGAPLGWMPRVTLTTKQVTFNEKTIVALDDAFQIKEPDRKTALVVRLYDELAEEADKSRLVAEAHDEKWVGELTVVADARVPYSTLADVLYTASRAEFSNIAIVTSRPTVGLGKTQVTPESLNRPITESGGLYAMRGPNDPNLGLGDFHDPTVDPDAPPPEKIPFLAIELTAVGFTLSAPGLDEETSRHGAADLDAITKLSERLHKSGTGASAVYLSAEPDVPLSRVVAALAAVRGPECKLDGDGCLLLEAKLVRDGAHEYRPKDWPPEEDVWGGLTGDEIGEAYGVGGLGLVGTGRGTGEGTIGLGNTGLIGLADNSNGGSGSGGNGKRVPRIRQGKHTVDGPLDKDIIRRIVRAHINEVRSCYNTGLEKDESLSGKLEIEFTIGRSGKVSKSEAKSTTLSDEMVGTCTAKAVKRWKFPKPRGGETVKVVYPFTLDPG